MALVKEADKRGFVQTGCGLSILGKTARRHITGRKGMDEVKLWAIGERHTNSKQSDGNRCQRI
jgi:hypothetical protein